MKLKKVVALLVAISMVAVLLAGCAGSNQPAKPATTGTDAGKSSQTVKLVHLAPLTGSSASYGYYMLNSSKMAVEEINAAGGIKLPDGSMAKIDYSQVDESSTSEGAINGVRQAISMNPIAMIGPNRSGGILATEKLWKEAKIPTITDGTSQDVTRQGNPYTFRMQISSEYWIPLLVKTAVKSYGVKKPAILYAMNDYSKANYVVTGPELDKLGVKPVTVQSGNDGDQDFSAQLVAIKNSGADSLFLYTYAPEMAKILRQMNELGMKLKIFSERTASTPSTIDAAGDQFCVGIIATTTLSLGDTRPEVQAWYEKYYKEFGNKTLISGSHINHYDSVYILKSVIEKVGLDREKIRTELANLKDFKGTLGKYTADKEGNLVHYMYTQEYLGGGKWKLMDYEEYPVAK